MGETQASGHVGRRSAPDSGARPRAGRRRARRLGGDDGAVLVEFALVMPILLLFLFGMVEFGINLNDYQSIRQAARDGARQAVVADYGTGSCAPPASATAAQNAAAVACTAKAATDLDDVAARVIFTDQNGATDFSADKVRVCLAADARSITGLLQPFLSPVTLKTSVEMRAEKNLTLANYTADADPSGGNWSWCA